MMVANAPQSGYPPHPPQSAPVPGHPGMHPGHIVAPPGHINVQHPQVYFYDSFVFSFLAIHPFDFVRFIF